MAAFLRPSDLNCLQLTSAYLQTNTGALLWDLVRLSTDQLMSVWSLVSPFVMDRGMPVEEIVTLVLQLPTTASSATIDMDGNITEQYMEQDEDQGIEDDDDFFNALDMVPL
ncbi:hypothetical protein F4703DRAFT_1788150 [Phycomyces blakesleeanus]